MITLSMIVKNEAHVIERCLKSVLPVIDRALICDTGSTDGTYEVVKNLLDGSGKIWELHKDEWVDFGHNRSVCIDRARFLASSIGYILTMDADHVWHGEMPALTADGYRVEHRYCGTVYGLACLVKASLPWRYEGALHEIITCEQAGPFQSLPAPPWVEVFHEGARSRDPSTYKKDAAILRAYLNKHPNDPRTAYYLAQSLKDSGDLEAARTMYLYRSGLEGWWEERAHATYRAAQIAERFSPESVTKEYLAAWQMMPNRAEPLVALALWHRMKKDYHVAAMFAERAMSIPKPESGLFVEENIYDWRAADEFAVAAYYAGRTREGLAVCRKLLQGPLPDTERKRVEANVGFFLKAA